MRGLEEFLVCSRNSRCVKQSPQTRCVFHRQLPELALKMWHLSSAVSLCALTWGPPSQAGSQHGVEIQRKRVSPPQPPVLPWRKSLVALGGPCDCDLKQQLGIFFIAWG